MAGRLDRELAEGTVQVCVLQVSCDRSLGSRKQRYERGIGSPGVVFWAAGLTGEEPLGWAPPGRFLIWPQMITE